MDNITYNSIKNELLDVVNGRLNDFNTEMTNKIESFKNEMIELFNSRIINYATTSNHNFDDAKRKIDETLNTIKSDFDKSISKFDKASEILNFGNLNINSDSIISLFSAQTNSDNAIKQLSGSVFTIKDNIKKIESKQDDFIFNLSGVSFNSGFTLDFSGSMMTILRDEMNSLYESNYDNIDSRLNNFEARLSGFGGTLKEFNGKFEEFDGTLGEFDGKITNFEDTLSGFSGTLSGFDGKFEEFDTIGDDIKQVKSDMGKLNGQITEFGKELEGFNEALSGINTSIETVNNDISGLTRQVNNFESDIKNVKTNINTLSGRMDNFITSGYLEDKKFICEDNLNKFDIVTDESLTKTLSGYTTTEQVTGMIKFHIPDSLE